MITVRDVLRSIGTGKAQLVRLGLTQRLADASPEDKAAITNSTMMAAMWARYAADAMRHSDYPHALHGLLRSFILEEATGNDHGVCSDLANLGLVWFLQGRVKTAAAAYEYALKLHEWLGKNLPGDLLEIEKVDYTLLRARAAEGLAMCQDELGDLDCSAKNARAAIDAYEEAGLSRLARHAEMLLHNAQQRRADTCGAGRPAEK